MLISVDTLLILNGSVCGSHVIKLELSVWLHYFLDRAGSLVVDGVDVTGHPIFNDPKAGAKSNCFGKESSQRPVPEDW